MEETIVESSEIVETDEAIEEQAKAETDSDKTIEDKLPNKAEYRSEHPSNEEYQSARNYKNRSKIKNSKNTQSKKSGLERAVADSEAIAKGVGIDQTELLSAKLAQRSIWYGTDGEEESTKKSDAKERTREIHDSFDGAHAIIYHRDPETGKIYFAFEKKPADYPIAEYAGTLSLYGGSLKIGEAPNEGLVRELKEEDPNSYKIIIKALNETRWKVDEITTRINGVPSTTYIWAAEIKDPHTWMDYLSGRSIEGAKTPKSLEEILGMKNSDFAFGFGPVVKQVANILSQNYGKKSGYSPSYNFYSNNMLYSTALHSLN